MCACGTPTENGHPGYRWQPNDPSSIRIPQPPPLREDDRLLLDAPGRCGGVDSHCHHFAVVHRHGEPCLLYRHGGGDGAIRLSNARAVISALFALDRAGQYWLLHAIFHAHKDGERSAADRTSATWAAAAIEKRIKLSRRQGRVSVRIVQKDAL